MNGDQAVVLVLEDDPALLGLLCAAIEDWGYRALPAPGSSEALRLAADEPRIDLALADVGLLERASVDVLGQVRAAHPGLRSVQMSGYQSAAAEELDEGRFLLKPFALEALEAALADALAAP